MKRGIQLRERQLATGVPLPQELAVAAEMPRDRATDLVVAPRGVSRGGAADHKPLKLLAFGARTEVAGEGAATFCGEGIGVQLAAVQARESGEAA